MPRRSVAQLALLVVGLLVWAYGQRTETERIQLVGVGFFAAAVVLRFFKHRDPPVT